MRHPYDAHPHSHAHRGGHDRRSFGPDAALAFGPDFGPDGPGSRSGSGFGSGFGFGGPGFGGPDVGPGRGGRGPGGRGRGRRGDVRAAILALLSEAPMNGYQLIQAINEKSDGLWTPSAGSVYPALGLLEDEGLIAPREEGGKKLFALTDTGTQYVAEHTDEVDAPWQRVTEPHRGMLDVRTELGQLGMAVQQVVVAGQKEQVKAVRGILDRARRDVYRVLAEDEPRG